MSETTKPNPPPIQPTPGDLRMIYRTAIEDLNRIELEAPGDMDQVLANLLTVASAMEFWILEHERRGRSEVSDG